MCIFRFLIDIHDEERQTFLDDLSKARFISLLVDGETDSTNLDDEIIYVKFLDSHCRPAQLFLGIHDGKHASASGVLDAVDTGVYNMTITVSNFDRSSGPMNI